MPTLSSDSSIKQMVETLGPMRRDLISAGYDTAMAELAQVMPMEIHRYPTGTACWTWEVPEAWSCKEAWLETLDGERIFSYDDHPLHVVSYSLPFSGEVTRDELFAHLHTHNRLSDAIPMVFHYYNRQWGLCCTEETKQSLSDEKYRVHIDTEFSKSDLQAGEIVVPGDSERCFVFCGHLCHPTIVNDGLLGVAVFLDIMRELAARSSRRYTYRLLICPEAIGSAAYLSHHESLIPTMLGGLFTEMIGLPNRQVLHRSFEGNSVVDRLFCSELQRSDPNAEVVPYFGMNDERQFNSPGVRVPMLALYRYESIFQPYPEYHSSADDAALVDWDAVNATRETILRFVDTLEQTIIPVNNYTGEVFLSRYGLPPAGYYQDAAARDRLLALIYAVDGTRSVSDLAEQLEVSEGQVLEDLNLLKEHELVTY